MENLRIFDTQEKYEAWKDSDDYVFPNICKVGEEIIYNDFPDPLWIEALEDITVSLIANYGGGDIYMGSWSFDKISWTKFSSKVTVRLGQKMYIKCIDKSAAKLNISGKYNVGGNILSLDLEDYNEYLDQKPSDTMSSYGHVFANAKSVVNAKDLVLPRTMWYTSGQPYYAFCEMLFKNCTLLETAPKLVSNYLDTNCYVSMFEGCTNLKKAPTLFAERYNTSYSTKPYKHMFKNCNNLTYIKLLDMFKFGSLYEGWVDGVSPEGMFIANSKRSDFTRGINGIPEGWNLYLYDVDNDRYEIRFRVNSIPYEMYTSEPTDITWEEFINNNSYNGIFELTDSEDVLYNGKLFYINDVKQTRLDFITIDGKYTTTAPIEPEEPTNETTE